VKEEMEKKKVWSEMMDEEEREQKRVLREWISYAEELRSEKEKVVERVRVLEVELSQMERGRNSAVCSAVAQVGALRMSWARKLKCEEEVLRMEREKIRREQMELRVEKESFNYWAGVVKKKKSGGCEEMAVRGWSVGWFISGVVLIVVLIVIGIECL
jgi:hypothetical protein